MSRAHVNGPNGSKTGVAHLLSQQLKMDVSGPIELCANQTCPCSPVTTHLTMPNAL